MRNDRADIRSRGVRTANICCASWIIELAEFMIAVTILEFRRPII